MPPRPAPAAPPAWHRTAILALAALLFLTWFTGEIADTDIWLHLLTGRHTLENRALTVPDPFCYTSSRTSAAYAGEAVTRYFNLTHEWLAQIGMFATYAATGFPGLVLLRAFLLIAFCALVGLMVWWRNRGFVSRSPSFAGPARRLRGGFLRRVHPAALSVSLLPPPR